MKKLVMTLAILAMAGAATLGVMNMKDLKSEQVMLAEAKEDLLDAKKVRGELDDSLVTATEDRSAAKDARDQTSADLSLTNEAIKRQESQIANLQKEIEAAQVKKKEIDLVVLELDVKNVEELESNIQMQKDMLANRQNELQAAMAELETKKQDTLIAENAVRELQQERIDHAKNVALNGLEATVIAVNREWGFVMVNVGKALGVAADASLLVKRGGERIARLRITDISEEVLMAEIVEGSLIEGGRVTPGDKVIFENTK